MAARTFKCAACGRTFEASDEEFAANEAAALAEAKEVWGEEDFTNNPNFVRICNDCYETQTPEQVKAMGQEYQERKRRGELG